PDGVRRPGVPPARDPRRGEPPPPIRGGRPPQRGRVRARHPSRLPGDPLLPPFPVPHRVSRVTGARQRLRVSRPAVVLPGERLPGRGAGRPRGTRPPPTGE